MRRFGRSAGFALPTVVIVGTVLFGAMVVVLSSTSSVRTTLDTQFYEALARDAAESGAVHAKDCINDPVFMAGTVTITPQTNCAGVVQPSASLYVINNISASPKYRTTYSAKIIASSVSTRTATVSSKVEVLRGSDGSAWKTYLGGMNVQKSVASDPVGDRKSQRYWYFGKNAGLDFGTSGTQMPTVISSPGSAEFKEGSTVISDQEGNLQFFSDGLNIWNKTGATMSGSTSPNLRGASSATQAVAAFPLDSSRTKYAVISNSGQVETGLGELYLHIIDMTQNGGLGAVVSKNYMLGTGKSLGFANAYNGNNADKSYSGEGFGVMPKADGSGYFVYTYNSAFPRIIGFFISVTGVVGPSPIVWTMNPVPTRCNAASGQDLTSSGGVNATSNVGTYGYGTINFTKDYSKMVLLAGALYCGSTTNGRVYYLDVNPLTGALSLKASWLSTAPVASAENNGYSADFSPGEGYVYVSQIYPGYISRYSLANLANVSASEWSIDFATNGSYAYQAGGQIKRGPDGRMYVADRNTHYGYAYGGNTSPIPVCKISYIGNPDSATETAIGIDWKVDGITLGFADTGPCSIWGLPQTATVYTPKVTLY